MLRDELDGRPGVLWTTRHRRGRLHVPWTLRHGRGRPRGTDVVDAACPGPRGTDVVDATCPGPRRADVASVVPQVVQGPDDVTAGRGEDAADAREAEPVDAARQLGLEPVEGRVGAPADDQLDWRPGGGGPGGAVAVEVADAGVRRLVQQASPRHDDGRLLERRVRRIFVVFVVVVRHLVMMPLRLAQRDISLT